MQKVFRITVDISKKIPASAFEVNTNDLKSVKLEITITNGQSLLDLTDVTPRINIRKPDNEVIFQDCEIVDAKSGKVQIILENQAYLVPGTHTAEIMCYKGSDVVAVTGTFSYKSTKGIMNDEAVESKSEFTAIDRKIAEARKLLEDIGENGVGVDEQARQEIQEVSAQLADTVKEVNGVKPTNGKVTIPVPEVDTSRLATKEELSNRATLTELNTERARINNLVANAGNTDNNAELLDIRVGASGETYPNAGESLRAINTGQTVSGSVASNRSITVNRRIVAGKKYYVMIQSYSGSKLNSVGTFIGSDTSKDFTFSGIGQLKSFVAWANGDTLRFYANLSANESPADIVYKIFSEDDVLGKIERANEKLGENIIGAYTDYTKTGPSIDVNINIAAGETYRFKIAEYTGQNLRNVTVFLYSTSTEYTKLGDYNIGDIDSFTAQTNLVRVRFYYNASPSENVPWTVKMRKINGLIIDRVEGNEIELNKLKSLNSNKLKGLVLNVLGDSFTAPQNAYHSYIASRNGMAINNYGVSGSAVSTSGANPMSTRYTGMTNTCDLVGVFGGINDSREIHVGTASLGTINDTVTTTFYGAYKILLEGLIDKYPGKVIFTITPPHLPTSDYTHKLADVAKAIKEVSALYGIPCADLYSGCNGFNGRASQWALYHPTSTTNSSGYDIHPNVEGQKKLSVPIENFIKNLIV